MVMASASDVLVVPHGSFGWWKACFFLGILALIFIRVLKKNTGVPICGNINLSGKFHLVIKHGSGTCTIYRSISQ